jgi:SAM-dependent methyltransferase
VTTQNVYDNQEFFEGYSRLPRSIEGLDGAPEWPALRDLVGDVRGLRVLDLGCGFGWFCRWAREQGASRVLGLDVSDAAVTYRRADLETLELSPAAFDVVYSSLALHYLERLDRLAGEIQRALGSGGRLVFSVEHPIYTAPEQPGWSTDAAGRQTWPVDHYLEEGPRSTDWLTKGVIKHHRTIGTYLGLLLQHGFTITHVEEWGPTNAQIAAKPTLAVERQRPAFLLVAARR